MSRVGLVSAKGSPGVTTLALAMAAAVEDAVVVELDPSGGTIECWQDAGDEPGLVRVAHGCRRKQSPGVLDLGVAAGPLGVNVVLSPTSGPRAESLISALDGLVDAALASMERTVVIDGGRWAPSQPTAGRLKGCDVVGVVCRPTVESVEAARWMAEPLGSLMDVPVVLALVGDRPYSSPEVEAAAGVQVAAVVPWEPRAVAALIGGQSRRAWQRTRFARGAREAWASLDRLRSAPGVPHG